MSENESSVVTLASISGAAISSTASPRAGWFSFGRWSGRLPPLGNGAYAVLDQAAVSAANFATSVLLGRMASPDNLGAYYLALSLFYFVRGIQEQLISAPFTVYSQKRSPEEVPAYVGSAIIHQIALLTLTMAGLGILDVILTTGHGPQQFVRVLPILLGAIPFLLVRDVVRQYSFARFEARTALCFDVAVGTIQIGGLATLAAMGRLSVGSTYAVMAVASAAAVGGWCVLVRPTVRIVRGNILPDWRRNWDFGRWALASQLLGATMSLAMPWIVAATEGETAAGVLSAAGTLVGIANMFVIGLGNYLSPRAAKAFADGGVEELGRVLRKIGLFFGVLLGSFWAVTLVAGGWLMTHIYGDAYAGGGLLMSILALNLLVASAGLTAGNGLWAMDRPQANFRADVTMLLTTIAATVWLVPAYHATGTAAATLLGTTAGTIVRIATLVRLMNSPAESLRARDSGGTA